LAGGVENVGVVGWGVGCLWGGGGGGARIAIGYGLEGSGIES